MKGLLRKDLYMLWAYCKIYVLLLPLFMVSAYFQPDNFFFSIYPGIIMGILPITLLSYEEKCKWNVFCQTLPVPRWKVVVEKYLLATLGILIISVFSAVVQYCIFRTTEPFDRDGYMSVLTMLLCLSLGGPSILLPIVFRLGTEKGRLAYYFVIGAAFAIGGFLSVFAENFVFPQISSLAIVPAALALFCLSCLLSIRFYEKREL